MMFTTDTVRDALYRLSVRRTELEDDRKRCDPDAISDAAHHIQEVVRATNNTRLSYLLESELHELRSHEDAEKAARIKRDLDALDEEERRLEKWLLRHDPTPTAP